jgi:N-acetylmuramoyl-L-alanine amidase
MNRLRLKILAGTLVSALLVGGIPAEAKRTVAQKKRIARTQFEQAERLREALRGKPEKKRTRQDYQRAVDAYRKVYYTAPTSERAAESALAVGDLLVDSARAFDDRKALIAAIGQYEFLRREYPGSKYRVEALFTIGQIYHEDLDDNARAVPIFEEFLKRYPNHDLADAATEALSEIRREDKEAKEATIKGKKPKRPERSEKAEVAETKKPKKPAAPESEPEATPVDEAEAGLRPATQQTTPSVKRTRPLLTSIRHWSTPDYTRVVIDLDDETKYETGRVTDPDRIFFDLQNTKLASELVENRMKSVMVS